MSLALPRLLQLASPALPVGAYTYSQGLEWAVELGVVRDQATALQWIAGLLEEGIGRFEAPLTACLQRAWAVSDQSEVERLNAEFLASRESSELRAETVQMGYSLRRLLHDLDDFPRPPAFAALPEVSFPAAWALAAAVWEIPVADSLIAYLWSWCENQVMAALKAIPLGQAAGQRALLVLGGRIPALVQQALDLPEADWSNFAPGLALASSRHETQYSRLFRS
ncbi:Urease accessory protein UreF [Candidatus Accumulibacter aalborgensis]|uniref:Urease accessory protein UreF n=1 Tax=Candidatus Accumulibacter aalborgensis TaxID=1860102 RepID=A0A1A8XSG3_9PROT|nr:urease accessory protein UreF [Candidatus Accumulibacter aalborgensis]SBT08039.1 Urease accessory protein UreF [Candidatus Accumulibacter aalborgensis]